MDKAAFLAVFGRPLRLALVGGGTGSWIGEVHRIAARLDGLYEIVAGVFSSDPKRSRTFAKEQNISEERAYARWQDLIQGEARHPNRVDAIAVITPNDSHYPICLAALEEGFDVICDKPLTTSFESAMELARKSEAVDRVLALTHCYSAYPMVRQARAMVRQGLLGDIRQVHVQYVQGWSADNDLSGWRMDQARVGGSSILLDLGTHAYHLACTVTGLEADEVMADLCHTVPGRSADDYAGLLLRYRNGAHGTLWVTSAAAGSEHGLMFRIFGEDGGLEWHQETPNALIHMPKNNFARTLTRRRSDIMSDEALQVTRTEVGHPEGFLEAFANVYSAVAWHIAARNRPGSVDVRLIEFPTAADGAAGLAFTEAATVSSSEKRWTSIKRP
jgi:predicted dehydrogenase